jgi:hypothetical protein
MGESLAAKRNNQFSRPLGIPVNLTIRQDSPERCDEEKGRDSFNLSREE